MRKDAIAAKDPDNLSKVQVYKDRIASNKLHDLYVSGVYQSIADEIFALDDDSIYAQKVGTLLDPISEKLNDKTKAVFKEAALTHDSKAYSFLKEATQLSDFVARYALHQHNLEKNGDSVENREASMFFSISSSKMEWQLKMKTILIILVWPQSLKYAKFLDLTIHNFI